MSQIRLSFHQDTSPQYPTGYWVAEAAPDAGSADYDGAGMTPLDAVMAMAKQMYDATQWDTTGGQQ